MRLRLGLIGLGDAWQHRHRPALMMMRERFQVQAVYAPVSHLASQAARDFEAAAVDGFRSLIARSDIDAVMILDSGWQGWLPLLAACDNGKAVYWASQLDLSAQKASELRDAVDQSGIAFMAEFPRRFAPATLRLKELLATQLGRPKMIFCHHRASSTPMQNVASSKDVAARELLELVDWCRYVVDANPRDVFSTAYAQDSQELYRHITLRFGDVSDSPCAQISSGRYVPAAWQEAIGFRPNADMQIVCENGLAFVDLPTGLVWFDDAGRHLESLDTELPVGEQMLIQFHRAVTSLVRKMANLEDAHYGLQILKAAETSSVSGKRIDLRDLFVANS